MPEREYASSVSASVWARVECSFTWANRFEIFFESAFCADTIKELERSRANTAAPFRMLAGDRYFMFSPRPEE